MCESFMTYRFPSSARAVTAASPVPCPYYICVPPVVLCNRLRLSLPLHKLVWLACTYEEVFFPMYEGENMPLVFPRILLHAFLPLLLVHVRRTLMRRQTESRKTRVFLSLLQSRLPTGFPSFLFFLAPYIGFTHPQET